MKQFYIISLFIILTNNLFAQVNVDVDTTPLRQKMEKTKEQGGTSKRALSQHTTVTEKDYRNATSNLPSSQKMNEVKGKTEVVQKVLFQAPSMTEDDYKNEVEKQLEEARQKVAQKFEGTRFMKKNVKMKEKVMKGGDYKEFIFSDKRSIPEMINLDASLLIQSGELRAVEIAPLFDIPVTNKFSLGIGPDFQYSFSEDAGIKSLLGIKTALRYEVLKNEMFLQFENITATPDVPYINTDQQETAKKLQNGQAIGITYSFKEKLHIPINTTVSYQLNPSFQQLTDTDNNPVNIKIGFDL